VTIGDVTIGEWLDTRTPAPPEALAARLRAALGSQAQRDARELPDRALDAALVLLAALMARECTRRDQALDLLAADALVTYAFEAGSDAPERLAAQAEGAMQRIAALAEPAVAPRGAP
jgi:hypothetical protein